MSGLIAGSCRDRDFRRDRSGRARWLRLTLLSSISFAALTVHAQGETWTGGGAPDPNEWNQDNNWTPAAQPTGTATFDVSAFTSVNSSGLVGVGAIDFLNTASTYTITTSDIFLINGAGVTNNSAATQHFNILSTLVFQNSASAATTGSVTYTNSGAISFLDTSTAGSATINNNGDIEFNTNSSGGNSTIVNNAVVNFQDSSTAGAANITNNASGQITFNTNSTAGTATITNSGGLSFDNSATAGSATINSTISSFATITFNNTSTAGSSHIDLVDGILTFNNSSKAGSTTITMSNAAHAGSVTFNGTSSAENATITNVATLTVLGTSVKFLDQSTAGNATINNNFNAATASGGDLVFGTLGGTDTANAGTAHITNNTGTTNFLANTSASSATITNNSSGNTNFQDQSTAANATIINNSGGTTSFGVPTFGTDTATAGNANITNNSGGTTEFFAATTAGNAVITNNAGGFVQFGSSGLAGDTATAGNAAITNNGTVSFNSGTTGGNATITTNSGGNVFFFDSSTGGGARFITNAGGTFDASGLSAAGLTAGSIEGAGNYILGSKALTTGSNNLSTTVSGVISGVGGSLTKTGTGTLTLSNVNTYTGNTNVNGGLLQVNGSIATSALTTVNTGAELIGTGIVGNTSIAAGGIFVPGNLTPGSSMTVTGNLGFASGAFYGIVVNPTTASFSTVSGTATLGGATVNASFAADSYISKQYTILTAGSVSGTFGGLVNTGLPYGFTDTLSYDATHAYLNLSLVFAPPTGSLNDNQQNVANAIINSFNTVGTIPIVFSGLTPDQLSQLSGEIGASFPQVAFQAGNSFLNLMLNPFISGRFGGGGFGAIGYAEEPRKKSAATDAFASVMPKQAPSFDERYSIWGSAFGGSGSISGNATTGSHDTKSQIYGFATGLDYKLTSNTLLGFALAGGSTHWSLDQGLGSGRSDMFQAGVYGMTRWGAAYLSAAAAYSFHDISTSRTVTIAGTDTLGAGFRANAFGGRLEGGYRFAAPWFGITPYGAVQVQSVALPSYGESATSGSNQFALNYASQTVTTTRSELGARFDKRYMLDQGAALTFYSRAAWAHDSGNTRSASAIFQALPVSNFTVNAAQPAPDSALVTAGVEYKMANGWSVLAKFDGEFSKTTSLYSGAGEIRKTW